MLRWKHLVGRQPTSFNSWYLLVHLKNCHLDFGHLWAATWRVILQLLRGIRSQGGLPVQRPPFWAHMGNGLKGDSSPSHRYRIEKWGWIANAEAAIVGTCGLEGHLSTPQSYRREKWGLITAQRPPMWAHVGCGLESDCPPSHRYRKEKWQWIIVPPLLALGDCWRRAILFLITGIGREETGR